MNKVFWEVVGNGYFKSKINKYCQYYKLIKSFFNKKTAFIKRIYLKDVLKISDGEELLKKYFNIDTTEPKFKEAVEDSKMSIEAQCHSYTINLNLMISIKFDLDKEFSEQEFPVTFTYNYKHSEPSSKPGF